MVVKSDLGLVVAGGKDVIVVVVENDSELLVSADGVDSGMGAGAAQIRIIIIILWLMILMS